MNKYKKIFVTKNELALNKLEFLLKEIIVSDYKKSSSSDNFYISVCEKDYMEVIEIGCLLVEAYGLDIKRVGYHGDVYPIGYFSVMYGFLKSEFEVSRDWEDMVIDYSCDLYDINIPVELVRYIVELKKMLKKEVEFRVDEEDNALEFIVKCDFNEHSTVSSKCELFNTTRKKDLFTNVFGFEKSGKLKLDVIDKVKKLV